MSVSTQTRCTAFEGPRRIGTGDLGEVAMKAKDAVDRGGQVLIFDDATSHPIELDLRGTADDVRTRLTAAAGGPAAEPAAATARSGPAEARRRRTRSHVAAAALGLAQYPARRCIGRAAQAGRAGAARERGQRPHPAIAGNSLPIHGSDGRRPPGLRGSDQGLVRGRRRSLRLGDRILAAGRAGPRTPARGHCLAARARRLTHIARQSPQIVIGGDDVVRSI